MTFPSAIGHGNFPQGNAFPVIFSKDLLINLRQNLVASEITNTKYEGEISKWGDTVNILKENVVTITPYSRGAVIPDQELDDEQIQLLIDQGFAYSFKIDDLEKRLSHIDWTSKQNNRAAFDLRKQIDNEILSVMRDNATTNSNLGASGSPKLINYSGSADFTPLNYLAKLDRLLSENDVPEDGRFFVAAPGFYEQLVLEEGSLADSMVTGAPSVLLNQNMMFGGREIHTFKMYRTTNIPLSANSDAITICGRKEATSTATALVDQRIEYIPGTFTKRYLGMTAYGRKVVRPEQLFVGFVKYV